MRFVIWMENNEFHIKTLDEWEQYLKVYTKPRKVMQTARLCHVHTDLYNSIWDKTLLKTVQILLQERWEVGTSVTNL